MEKFKNLFLKFFVTAWVEGPRVLFKKTARRLGRLRPYTYQDWIRNFEKKEQWSSGEKLKYQPKFTLILFESSSANDKDVEKTLKSIEDQIYKHFDQVSVSELVTPFIDIENLSWNDLLKKTSGDFLLPVQLGDQLEPSALLEIAKFLNKGKFDLIYSDEDEMDSFGKRTSPKFKPNYSPEFIESYNYIGNFIVFARSALAKSFLGEKPIRQINEYEIILALKEKASVFGHIAKILLHRQRDLKQDNLIPNEEVLRQHLKHLNRNSSVVRTSQGVFEIREKLTQQPKVSIVIPAGGKWEFLNRCLTSLFEKTTYKNYEVILIDNSLEEAFGEKVKEKFGKKIVFKKDWERPFNFSVLNNRAIKDLKTDYLLLLNDDMEVINPDWLEALIEQGEKQGVGVVGAKLIYRNNTIQQAGIIVGYNELAGNAFVGEGSSAAGYLNRLVTIQNYSAVTGACLLIKKDLYDQVGGLDEKLAVAFNDVDLCLKVIEKGYRVVWTPYAQLFHFESQTRGLDLDRVSKLRLIKEENYFKNQWGEYLQKGDPYYNPNLALNVKTFELKRS